MTLTIDLGTLIAIISVFMGVPCTILGFFLVNLHRDHREIQKITQQHVTDIALIRLQLDTLNRELRALTDVLTRLNDKIIT